MPTQLQFRRGTTSQNNSFTGAVGEITVDTDTDALILHDGSAAGGIEIIPAGTIVAFGNATAPTGWLICNDAAVSRSTYARLFAVIGTSFGTGDGSSNFNVPDMRDRVPLGKGTNMDTMGAATTGIAASAVITTGSTTQSVSTSTGTFASSAKDSSTASAVTAVNTSGHTHTLTLPSQVVQYIIKT